MPKNQNYEISGEPAGPGFFSLEKTGTVQNWSALDKY
jgi:hypothetical protein